MNKGNTNVITLINSFRNKAGCRHTEAKADQLLKQLKVLLSDQNYVELSISYNHFKLGEGATELYDVCKSLIELYKECSITHHIKAQIENVPKYQWGTKEYERRFRKNQPTGEMY